jgi:ubiquinone/menaquinone biosynthesis C-methylase UbiE
MEEDREIIQASSHRATNRKVFEIITREDLLGKRILDIGAGRGYMTQLLGNHIREKGGCPSEIISACDLYPEYFSYKEIACQRVEFIHELPFDKGSFDIAYAIEVIEHLKNPYDFIQEMFRVVRTSGKAIITTPNILNLSSRISYLLTGFFELFRPLSLDTKDVRRQWGHIMPLSAYYLNHAMRTCGFTKTELYADRLKKSSLFLYLLLFPVLKTSYFRYAQRLQRKKPVIYQDNKQELQAINGLRLCCSRSAILVGYKLMQDFPLSESTSASQDPRSHGDGLSTI